MSLTSKSVTEAVIRLLLALLCSVVMSIKLSLAGEIGRLKVTQQDIDNAVNTKKQAVDLVKHQMLDKYQELLKLEGSNHQVSNGVNNKGNNNLSNSDQMDITMRLTRLRIFVSQSMGIELLKAYYQQARKYGGSLVFNGLPQGSFKELAKLVLTITEQGEIGALEIDDEAFNKFQVSSVPAIILSREQDCALQDNCQVTYDSISGSIGIKAALEIFASNGDLAMQAQRLLQRE